MSALKSLVDVKLLLRGDLLDPKQVSLMLGVEGTKMRKKGDKWRTLTDREVTSKIGVWALAVKDRSLSISDQLSWLKSKLISATCIPLSIQGVDKAEVSVFIALGENERGGGDYDGILTAENLAWLSSLELPMSLTLTYVQEDEINEVDIDVNEVKPT